MAKMYFELTNSRLYHANGFNIGNSYITTNITTPTADLNVGAIRLAPNTMIEESITVGLSVANIINTPLTVMLMDIYNSGVVLGVQMPGLQGQAPLNINVENMNTDGDINNFSFTETINEPVTTQLLQATNNSNDIKYIHIPALFANSTYKITVSSPLSQDTHVFEGTTTSESKLLYTTDEHNHTEFLSHIDNEGNVHLASMHDLINFEIGDHIEIEGTVGTITDRYTGEEPFNFRNCLKLARSDGYCIGASGLLISCYNTNVLKYTDDGLNWTDIEIDFNLSKTSIIFKDGKFYLVNIGFTHVIVIDEVTLIAEVMHNVIPSEAKNFYNISYADTTFTEYDSNNKFNGFLLTIHQKVNFAFVTSDFIEWHKVSLPATSVYGKVYKLNDIELITCHDTVIDITNNKTIHVNNAVDDHNNAIEFISHKFINSALEEKEVLLATINTITGTTILECYYNNGVYSKSFDSSSKFKSLLISESKAYAIKHTTYNVTNVYTCDVIYNDDYADLSALRNSTEVGTFEGKLSQLISFNNRLIFTSYNTDNVFVIEFSPRQIYIIKPDEPIVKSDNYVDVNKPHHATTILIKQLIDIDKLYKIQHTLSSSNEIVLDNVTKYNIRKLVLINGDKHKIVDALRCVGNTITLVNDEDVNSYEYVALLDCKVFMNEKQLRCAKYSIHNNYIYQSFISYHYNEDDIRVETTYEYSMLELYHSDYKYGMNNKHKHSIKGLD